MTGTVEVDPANRRQSVAALTPLPIAHAGLLGRERELHELLEASAAHRLVTVVGTGGVGKSRLAIEAVHRLLDKGHRVAFVELADVVDASDVLASIATQCSVAIVAGASVTEGLIAWLGAAPTTMFVDNFEHVLSVAPEVAALVDACPSLRVVATSRHALGMNDEWVVGLRPLETSSQSGEAPAVQLFLERARIDDPDSADVDAAAKIVSALGGLPLAIELAATRAQALGAVNVLDLLVDELSFDGLDGPGGERHDGLRRCIEWSADDLDDAARAVFRATGAFAGTFDLPALRAVVGDDKQAAAGLAALVGHHLVDRVDDPAGRGARFSSLQPLRQYAREILHAHDTRDDVIAAHERWYAGVASALRRTYDRRGSVDAIAGLNRERTNIRAAVYSRYLRGDLDGAAAIACDIAKIIIDIGSEAQLIDWLRTLAHGEHTDTSRLGHEARIWIAFADLAGRGPAGATPPLRAMEEAIDAARVAGDDVAVLTGLSRVASSVTVHGDINRALQAMVEGAELAERLDLRRPMAEFSLWRGMLEHILGAFDDAFRHGDLALAIARELGDGRLLVRATLLLDPMARVANPPAGVAETVPTLDTALAIAREEGSALDEMYVLMQLAIHAAFEQRAEALALAGEGLALANRTRSTTAEVVFVFGTATAAFVLGDDDIAVTLHAALQPHRQTMKTLLPAATLARYAKLVDHRRSLRPEQFDERMRAAGSGLWPAVRAVATEYAQRRARSNDTTSLTGRELEVLEHLVRGESNPEIAAALGVRPKTAMHHCASIYRKLGVKSRVEATARALRDGLVEPR